MAGLGKSNELLSRPGVSAVSSRVISETRADSTASIRTVSTNAGRNRFQIKRLLDGRALLNLACGCRTHWAWNNVDFSPYARLRRWPRLARVLRRSGFISDERYDRLQKVDPGIVEWNLRRGIPFADDTFDVVYHSHFLEHLERASTLEFLTECHRVLRPGGMLRVVVPDLHILVSSYLESYENLEGGNQVEASLHLRSIHELFDQMVRTEITGALEQRGWRGRVERLIRGNAATAGELHLWVYDRYSLAWLLERAGFKEIHQQSASGSCISGWEAFLLDTNRDGSPYKPESLYMEATK